METTMKCTAVAMIMSLGITSLVAATTPTDAAIPTASTTTPTDATLTPLTSLTPLTPAQKVILAKENAQDAATGVPSQDGYKTH